MDKYYYIVSQMPGLYFDKECRIDVASFFEEVAKWMGRRDLKLLTDIDLYDTDTTGKKHPIFREYQNFEYSLRRDLSEWRRAARSGTEFKSSSFPAAMLKEGNPLEIEKKLLKYRWDFIEEKSAAHHFDLGFLILYLLKLQILGKLAEYNKDEGLDKYKQLLTIDLAPYLAPETEETRAG